jgi:hypothetical protein
MMLRGSRQEMTREMMGGAKVSLLLIFARGRRHIRRESACSGLNLSIRRYITGANARLIWRLWVARREQLAKP